MNRSFRCSVLFIISWLSAVALYSQAPTTKNNDSKSKDADTRSSFLSIGMDYYSNTNTLGVYTNDMMQSSFSPTISFYGKSGFFLTGATLFIQNADTSLSKTATEIDIQTGYRWDITSSLSLTPSYSHFFYSKNMSVLRSDYRDYFNLMFDAQSKWVFGNVAPSYVVGSKNAFILDAQMGFNLQFDDFLGKDYTLLIQPSVDLNFNNQDYYNKYAFVYFSFLQKYAQDNPGATIDQFRSYLQSPPSTLYKRLIERYLSRHPRIDKAYNKIKFGTLLSSLFDVTTKFTLSSVDVMLPISYSFKNLIFKLNLSTYKPLNQPSFMKSEWSFMCSFGVNYSFNW